MTRTVATIAFIVVVAVVGIVTGTRSTVIDGRVLAADILADLRKQDARYVGVVCEREIEVGVAGAVFRCTLTADDGSSTDVEYRMNRDGGLEGKVVGPAS